MFQKRLNIQNNPDDPPLQPDPLPGENHIVGPEEPGVVIIPVNPRPSLIKYDDVSIANPSNDDN